MATVFKSGKLVGSKKRHEPRLVFIRRLLSYLDFDFQEFVDGIEQQDKKSPVPDQLQSLLNQYCTAILSCIQGYPTASGKVTKKGCNLVEHLRLEMTAFDKSYSKLLSSCRVTRKKHQLICELNGSVAWFINQHNMTYGAIKVSTPFPTVLTKASLDDFIKKEKIALKAAGVDKKILAHRPKSWELIEVFLKSTAQHKKEKGSTKFMQYKSFCKQLDEHNKGLSHGNNKLSVSEKGYYNLKNAWRNNTLENFV
jgi:hypothetical protein